MSRYFKVATCMPDIKVGNVKENLEKIKAYILELNNSKVKMIVFPELSLTSNSLMSYYKDDNILRQALEAIFDLVVFTLNLDILIFISIPFKFNNAIYETTVVIKSGAILGMVPRCDFRKDNKSVFSSNENIDGIVNLIDEKNDKSYFVPFSPKLKFISNNDNELNFFANINNDFSYYTNQTIVANQNSISESIKIDDKIKYLKFLSKHYNTAIVSANPHISESTSKVVYFSRSFIVECGDILVNNEILTNHFIIEDLDIDKIVATKINSDKQFINESKDIYFDFDSVYNEHDKIDRVFDATPYINKKTNPYNFSMHIINMEAVGLAKRLNTLNIENIVLGLSGGLDSTIALLIAEKTKELLSLDKSKLHIYSLPGLGTSNMTRNNIYELCESLNVDLKEINISNLTNEHFKDINHDIDNINTTYENAQARIRTLNLMDIANDVNGLMIGTSDLSEICLGFSTFNGDHMSMYNVNGSITKTLIRYIINSIADENIAKNKNVKLAEVLKRILQTPVSPELKPTQNGDIAQKTEEILADYLVIDCIIYHYLKYHYDINKLFDILKYTFVNEKYNYTEEYLKNAINLFFRMYKNSQFKRNISPDYIDIGILGDDMIDFSGPSDIETWIQL